MDFTLRPAVRTDADALGALHVACWRETYHPHLLSNASFRIATPEWRATRYRRYLPAEPGPLNGHSTWIAEADGEPIGLASSGPGDEGDLQLHAIYVLRRAHGTGVGQALLDEALGGESAGLWVAEENPRARAFYERNGFALTGIRKLESFILDEIAELRMTR